MHKLIYADLRDKLTRRNTIMECVNVLLEQNDKYKAEDNKDGQIACLVCANKLMDILEVL